MTGTALILIAISLGDLISGGLAGEPVKGARTVLGLVGAMVCATLGAWWIGFAPVPSLLVVTLAIGGTAGWLWAKSSAVHRKEGQIYWRLALAVIAVVVVLAITLAETWGGGSVAALDRWLAALPYTALGSVVGDRFLLFAAVMLFLTGPANAVVRGVLTVAGTEWKDSEEKLRGGRFIGVLERWMIFALAVAGEPTAAALIVSAKSLLRFPELSGAARDSESRSGGALRVDLVTEYFLLGSLVSWALALAPVVLFL